MKTIKIILVSVVIALVAMSFNYYGGKKAWVAPKGADALVNPLKGNVKATEAGKKIYIELCAICHGKKGKGDGIGATALNPKPANYSKESVQSQTDGALYWKLSSGRAPMASYKDILTPIKRWQLVNYIRTFKKVKK